MGGGEFTVQARYLGDLVDDWIAITPSHPPTVQAGQYEVGWGGTLGAFGCLCLGNRVMYFGALLVLYLGTLWRRPRVETALP